MLSAEVIRMTLSYRIIKSDNLHMSQEGVQISKAEPEKKVEPSADNTPGKDKRPPERALSPQDKEKILLDYRTSLEEDRKRILEEIRVEAEKKAKEDLQKAKERGFNEGHTEGYQRGYQEAQEENRALQDQARQVLLDAQTEAQEYFEREKESIIRLAGQMAELIVNHEIDLTSQTIVDLISPVLQEFRKGGTVIIYCNRRHMRRLKENIFSLKKINGNLEYLVMDKPELENNEFNLEYDNQIIDLEVSGQIQSMVQQLLDMEV